MIVSFAILFSSSSTTTILHPSCQLSIENYPRPTNEKQLKSYFDKASYYREFIPSSRRIAAPLYALQKANFSFEWATEQELAFQKLKEKLVSKPILQYPDFMKEFILMRAMKD
jgi:hypothetical protein